MRKIAVYTQSYNAVKTMERTIKSVLQQDVEGDFLYYIVDNNSTDGTQQVIADYAKKDKRIIPFFFDENLMLRGVNFMQNMAKEGKAEYIAMLDADDEYMPGAFQDLANFADEHNLDVDSGGHIAIIEETGKTIEPLPVIKDNALHKIVNKTDLMNIPLNDYSHHSMVWAKLFRSSTLTQVNMDTQYHKKIRWGWDSVFTLSVFQHCMKIGFLKGIHHKYYQMNNSFIRAFNIENILSLRLYDDFLREYITKVQGQLNRHHEMLLAFLYMSNVNIMLSHIEQMPSNKERIKALKLLLNNRQIKDLINVWKENFNQQRDAMVKLENVILWLKQTDEKTKEAETIKTINDYLQYFQFGKN